MTPLKIIIDHLRNDSDDNAFLAAARNGDIDAFKYLVSLEKGTEAKSRMILPTDYVGAFGSAARNGHIETLKLCIISKILSTLSTGRISILCLILSVNIMF